MSDPFEVIAATKIPGAGRIGRTAAKYIIANLEVAGFKIDKIDKIVKSVGQDANDRSKKSP